MTGAAVGWRSAAAAEVPAGDGWLAAGERRTLATLRLEKRRRDWRLGRWTAKGALAAWLRRAGPGADLTELEVVPAEDGAPEAWWRGNPLPVALSLSHAGGIALCAVAAAGTSLGCDLEQVEARSPAFVADYFTVGEQTLLAATPPPQQALYANLLWSAKESALKALRQGLRLDTRAVEVELPAATAHRGWQPLRVIHAASGRAFDGWWRREGSRVLTLVAAPAPAQPVRLHPCTPG